MSKPRATRWDKMSRKQLEAATSEFDRPMVIDRSRTMNPAERAKWKAAKRGRPRVGRGSKAISVTIEAELLERTDRLARKQGVSRAQLIARGLQSILKAG